MEYVFPRERSNTAAAAVRWYFKKTTEHVFEVLNIIKFLVYSVTSQNYDTLGDVCVISQQQPVNRKLNNIN